MRKLIYAAFLVAGSALPSSGQDGKPQWVDTKFEALDSSLEALLNDGYEIVSGSQQSSMVLRKELADGYAFVTCVVAERGGYGDKPQVVQSYCVSLN